MNPQQNVAAVERVRACVCVCVCHRWTSRTAAHRGEIEKRIGGGSRITYILCVSFSYYLRLSVDPFDSLWPLFSAVSAVTCLVASHRVITRNECNGFHSIRISGSFPRCFFGWRRNDPQLMDLQGAGSAPAADWSNKTATATSAVVRP